MSRGKVYSFDGGRVVASPYHVATPASATEICESLGITPADRERVRRLLARLQANGSLSPARKQVRKA